MTKRLKNFRKLRSNDGFTLMEFIIVIVLMIIIMAIGTMAIFRWIHHSEFIKSNDYAQQTYLTAENALVNMQSDGGIEEFVLSVVKSDTDTSSIWGSASGGGNAVVDLVGGDSDNYINDFTDTTFNGADGKPLPRVYALKGTEENYKAYQDIYQGTHYYATIDEARQNLPESAKLLYDLIDPYIYDKAMLKNTIIVEFDAEEGGKYPTSEEEKNDGFHIDDRVVLSSAGIHSVFFSTWAEDFTYSSAESDSGDDPHGVVSVNSLGNPDDSRDPDVREGLIIGYYSVDDTNNVVDIATEKVKMQDVDLINDERLDLKFRSSASADMSDKTVTYMINVYSDAEDESEPLFKMEFDANSDMTAGSLPVKVYALKDSYAEKEYVFPVRMDGTKYCITLDAMMTPKTVEANLDDLDNSISIVRFMQTQEQMVSDIYCDVSVRTTDASGNVIESKKLKTSKVNPLFSDVSNVTFDDDGNLTSDSTCVDLKKFRHISNIRYFSDENAFRDNYISFVLKSSLNWGRNSTDGRSDGNNTPPVYVMTTGYDVSSDPQFPTVPTFEKNWTFGTDANLTKAINNLYLGSESVSGIYDDTTGRPAGTDTVIGLFGVNKGKLTNVKLAGTHLILNSTIDKNEYDGLIYTLNDNTSEDNTTRAAGFLCGINRGYIENVRFENYGSDVEEIQGDLTNESVISAVLRYNSSGTGVGQVCGINQTPVDYDTQDRSNGLSNITKTRTEGFVYANVAGFDNDSVDVSLNPDNAVGIGGAVGYMDVPHDVYIGYYYAGKTDYSHNDRDYSGVVNHAYVTGNVYTGGIVGNIKSDSNYAGEPAELTTEPDYAQVRNCVNEGLILSNDEDGHFIGGVAGYAKNAVLDGCESVGGHDADRYDDEETAENRLREDSKGIYVGGIVGYAEGGLAYKCTTNVEQLGIGVIVGNENVGGIVGGTSTYNYIQASKADTRAETQNSSTVFGNKNIGGIIGVNSTRISNCVNSGIVGGFDENVGGVAGCNEGTAVRSANIEKCKSLISNDTDNRKFSDLKDVKVSNANNVGGIVGYNQYGNVYYNRGSLENDDINVIAIGNNNVGGIIGFNDVNGHMTISINNTLTEEEEEGATPESTIVDSSYISGKIYGRGNCVGGIIGLNLSSDVFNESSDLSSHMYQIEGKYAVGGLIGANLISLDEDEMRMLRMHSDSANDRAYIIGERMVGGAIGYNRVLSDPLAAGTRRDAVVNGLAFDDSMVGALDVNTNTNFIDDVDAPESNFVSGRGTFVVAGLVTNKYYINKTKVSGYNYVSGIIGKNDEDSRLIIRDGINAGLVSNKIPDNGVNTVSIANSDIMPSLALDASSEVASGKSLLIGGVAGENTPYAIIDNCTNEGLIETAFDGIGGIVGVNKGLILRCSLGDSIGKIDRNYIGGIASINYNDDTLEDTELYYCAVDHKFVSEDDLDDHVHDDWADDQLKVAAYTSGTVLNCDVETSVGSSNLTIRGNDNVGGVVALNCRNANVSGCKIAANVNVETDQGSDVGGVAGTNFGYVTIGKTVGLGDDEAGEARDELDISDEDAVDDYKDEYATNITGRNHVGGVVGYNRESGVVLSDTAAASTDVNVSVNGSNYVGGIVGYNDGTVGDDDITDIEAAEQGSRITGTANRLINYADVVAEDNYAGGVVGFQGGEKTISKADNFGSVVAQNNYAGGITSFNQYLNGRIEYCNNHGDVQSDNGYAGGITATNYGLIDNCTVSGYDYYPVTDENQSIANIEEDAGDGKVTITSNVSAMTDDEYAGIVTADNRGRIGNTVVAKFGTADESVLLVSDASVQGGIAGHNAGQIYDCIVQKMDLDSETMDSSTYKYTIGGIVGINDEIVYDSKASVDFEGSIAFSHTTCSLANNNSGNKSTIRGNGFRSLERLGGIAGISTGAVSGCEYSGLMYIQSADGAACYGGIVGSNDLPDDDTSGDVITIERGDGTEEFSRGVVTNCDVSNFKFYASGKGTQNLVSNELRDEDLIWEQSSNFGGIVGKNSANASVDHCYVDRNTAVTNNYTTTLTADKATSYMIIECGFVGGIVGYNSGTVDDCGAAKWDDVSAKLVHDYDEGAGEDNAPLNDESDDFYKDGFAALKAVTSNGAFLITTFTGAVHAGGIVAYNNNTASVYNCVSGSNWHMYGSSSQTDTGFGGIVGWDVGQEHVNLVNMATVVHQSQGNGRVSGVVSVLWDKTSIPNITNCYNFGYIRENGGQSRVTGILGSNKYNGVQLYDCHNYGQILGSGTGVTGIMSNIFQVYGSTPVDIYGCTNHGFLTKTNNTASTSSAGIFGYSQQIPNTVSLNIVNCANYAPNLQAGIAWSKTNSGTDKINYEITRCRNYAPVLNVFYDRTQTSGVKKFNITNCYLVSDGCTNEDADDALYSYEYKNYKVTDTENLSTKTIRPSTLGRFLGSTVDDTNNYYQLFSSLKGNNEDDNDKYMYYYLANGEYEKEYLINNILNAVYEDNIVFWGLTHVGNRVVDFDLPVEKIAVPDSSVTMANWINATAAKKEVEAQRKTDANRFVNHLIIDEFGGVDSDNDGIDDTTGDTGGTGDTGDTGESGGEEGGEDSGSSGGGSSSSTIKLNAPQNVSAICSADQANVWWTDSDSRAERFAVECFVYDTEEAARADMAKLMTASSETTDDRTYAGLTYFFGQDVSKDNAAKVSVGEYNGKYFVARVKACAPSVATSADSNWTVAAEPVKVISSLPLPDVVLEYKASDSKYHLLLKNADEYLDVIQQCEADGTDCSFSIYSGIYGNTDANGVKERFTMNDIKNGVYDKSFYVGQNNKDTILISSYSKTNCSTFTDSAMSTEMSSISKSPTDYNAKITSVSMNGTNMDDLSITYSIISVNSDSLPVYRVELVKVYEDGTEVVVQANNANASSVATTYVMQNFPDDLFKDDGENKFSYLKLRAWIAESGKGKVYFYHEAAEGETANTVYGNYSTLGDFAGKSYVSYAIAKKTPVEFNTAGILISGTVGSSISILPEPVLRPGDSTASDGTEILEPVIDENNSMSYRFEWDTAEIIGDNYDEDDYKDAKYKVALYGSRKITADDGTVSYTSSSINTGYEVGNNFVVDANNWNYDRVELRVTRIGTEDGDIGYTTSKTYDVYRRLSPVVAPTISRAENESDNLDYVISWTQRDDSSICKNFRLFMEYTDEEGTHSKELTTDNDSYNTVPDKVSTYEMTYNFEEYAGMRVYVYVVAYPQDGVMYKCSPNGNMGYKDIAKRADAPEISLSRQWSCPEDDVEADAVSEAEFANTALNILTAVKSTGNDTYDLYMQAALFDEADTANAQMEKLVSAIAGNATNSERISLANDLMNGDVSGARKFFGSYDADGSSQLPLSFISSTTTDGVKTLNYSNTLTSKLGVTVEDAGCYIIPLVRRASNASDDDYSIWAWDYSRTGSVYNGVLHLPRIKLDKPSATCDYTVCKPTGSAISYSGVDVNDNYIDEKELSDVSLPLKTVSWTSSSTIKAEAYDVRIVSTKENEDDRYFRINDNDGVLTVIPGEVKTNDDNTVEVTYNTEIKVSDAFVPGATAAAVNVNAKKVFGSDAILNLDKDGTAVEGTSAKLYTDTITVDGVVVASRSYTVGSDDEDITYEYTYIIPDSEKELDGKYVNLAQNELRFNIKQSAMIVMKMTAGAIDSYDVILPSLTTEDAPITFTVDGDKATVTGFTAYNDSQVDVTAVIIENTKQYVSSDVAAIEIWNK